MHYYFGVKCISVANLHSKILDALHPSFNFLHFHAVFGENLPSNRLVPPLGLAICPSGKILDPQLFLCASKYLLMDRHLQTVAFWVTNPCRITRKVKQTKMYVCTLEEFILVDLDTLLCKLEVN